MPVDVIVDARMTAHSGIGTYLRGLVGEYPNHPFFKRYSLGLALPEAFHSVYEGMGKLFRFNSPIYSLSEQMEYPFLLKQCRLWHAPHYNTPLVKGRCRLVVTVHDLIHWIFREKFYSPLQGVYARLLFQRVAKIADAVIAVSKQTREDLIRYFKVPPERIHVIYEGVSSDFFQVPETPEREACLEKYKLPRCFFLYVGLMKPHKNIASLVRVFKKLRAARRLDSSLVLVGKEDRKYSGEFHSPASPESGEGVYHIPQVESRRELACLYASARALVHPSLYEGFGLTCLEAMASGTPVVVSRIASLPEVVQEAGYYIEDPYSEDSIGRALVEVEQNEAFRRGLSERGRARAREFDWAKTAKETIHLYEELLGCSRQ